MLKLRQDVYGALERATEGGYGLFAYNAPLAEVADDLMSHDSEVEKHGASQSQIVVLVQSWRDAKKAEELANEVEASGDC